MKSKRLINIFMIAVLMFASGCATTGSVQESRQQSAGGSVITGIEIADYTINLKISNAFTYTMYRPSDPYKIIVELPDVSIGNFRDKITSNKAGVTEIVPSQIETPTLSARLEILLSTPSTVEPEFKDNSLIIKIKEEPAAEPAKQMNELTKAEEKTKDVKKVDDVKPERKTTEAKELPKATKIVQVNTESAQDVLKVTIKGNGSMIPNVFPLDNRIVIDIPDVTMSAFLPTSIPSPLKGIRAGKHKDKTRLVLDLKEKTGFDVTAVGDSVVVAIHSPGKEYAAKKEKSEEQQAKVEIKTPEGPVEGIYTGKKISLDFQDADITAIFRLLADISGYNIVISPEVRGRLTMKLINVPWDQALDLMLKTFSLGKTIEGNILRIAPISVIVKETEERARAKEMEIKVEELLQAVIPVNYAEAKKISEAVDKAKILSPRGSITIDERMNTLIVKDVSKSINKVKELVKIMDAAKPQVLIEARIVEASSDYNQTLGIRWGGSFSTGSIGGQNIDIAGSYSVNTPVISAGPTATNPGGVLGLTIGSLNTVKVDLSLQALEIIGKAKILSNPRVLTMDNESATIQQGKSIPVQTTSAEGTRTEFVDANLNLTVTPRITPDGFIQLKIAAKKNEPVRIEGATAPGIDKKEVNTQALVKDGETIVIGGIYTKSERESEQRVPLLGKIPILGWLFKTKSRGPDTTTELLIFITPTIAR